MKKLISILFLCMLFTNIAFSSQEVEKACVKTDALEHERARLFNMGARVAARELEREIASLRRACSRLKSFRRGYLSNLSGFSAVSFFDQARELLEKYPESSALKLIDPDLKDKFQGFVVSFLSPILAFIFDPANENNMGAFKIEMIKTGNDFVVALLDALNIKLTDIDSIEALFKVLNENLSA